MNPCARIARLDAAVACAADAWLTDPTDSGVYGRLVNAVLARRHYLHPPLDDDLEDPTAAGADDEPTATAGELGAAEPPPSLGELLSGDPGTALDRLRRPN